MPSQITVTVSGSERSVEAGTTAGALFEGDRKVVVARVDGELRDLVHPLAGGEVVEAAAKTPASKKPKLPTAAAARRRARPRTRRPPTRIAPSRPRSRPPA